MAVRWKIAFDRKLSEIKIIKIQDIPKLKNKNLSGNN